MAEDTPSYNESVSEERLRLQKAQLLQNYTQDSAIGRALKELQRKDLKTDLNQYDAAVQLKASVSRQTTRAKAWGGLSASRAGKVGVSYSTPPVSFLTPNNPMAVTGKGNGGMARYHTGRTTILGKAGQWTTEGFQENKEQLREQTKQMVLRSLTTNKGTVFDRVMNRKTGEREWKGKSGTFDANAPGGFTPTDPLKAREQHLQSLRDRQKEFGKVNPEGRQAEAGAGSSLADQFKQRRKEQMTTLAPAGIAPART